MTFALLSLPVGMISRNTDAKTVALRPTPLKIGKYISEILYDVIAIVFKYLVCVILMVWSPAAFLFTGICEHVGIATQLPRIRARM